MEDEYWTYEKFIDFMVKTIRGAVKAQGKISIPDIVNMILVTTDDHPEINGVLWAHGIEITNGHADYSGMTVEEICNDFDLNFDLDKNRVTDFVNIGKRCAVDEMMSKLDDFDEKEIDGKMCLVPA